jgi:hypothetical protein
MPVVAETVQTLQTAQEGAWFTATGNAFTVHVDNAGAVVRVETRRDAGDAALKRCGAGMPGAYVTSLAGASAFLIFCTPGLQFRLVSERGPASVAVIQ